MGQPDLMGMITSPSSWEQVIYDVVAWEGLDPWDIDLKKLADGFLGYVDRLEKMDFKVPAKFLMVSATLLRMKSDHLALLKYFQEEPDVGLEENGGDVMITDEPAINLLTIPPRRVPTRKIVVGELVAALKKAMGTSQRRTLRLQEAKKSIKLKENDIGKKIASLYDKINSILGKMKDEEVKFSNVVPKWTRPEVADNFVPLVFLDHEKKVECRQEDVFDEIYIKRGEGTNKSSKIKKKEGEK